MQIARRLPFPSENSAHPFTHPKRVCNEISSLLRGSNVYWRGQSFAASVPSDAPKVRKPGKKVPKDERLAMVESFVNKYRVTNAGKFPSISDTKKQVGGSHYTIRKILQELEYKSKTSPMKTMDGNILGKEVDKVKEASTDVAIDSGLENVGAEEAPETSTSSVKTKEAVKPKTSDDSSSHVVKQKHMSKGEAEVHQFPEKPKDGVEERPKSEGLLDLDGGPKEPKSEQHPQSPESDKFPRDLSEKKMDDDQESPKKSSVWGNLKSLADGFMNMWRKR